MATWPDNTTIGVPFVAEHPLVPILNFYSLTALFRVLPEHNGVRTELATRKDIARHLLARYFVENMTAEYLVFLDPPVMPPMHGVEYLVKAFQREKKCGVMAALTFFWPNGEPNLEKKVGTERLGGYSFPIYGPMMSEVGRWAVQHQEGQDRGKPLMVHPPHVIDVECFKGGLFVVSREVLEKFDGLYFHERKGWHMGTFCDKIRALGYSVKAAMNIMCAGGGVNHINFLQNYAKPVEE